ncbi:PKD domain-containing protein [bacterium]|nr:PKD domain-containing protein [bacterium]
MARYYSWLFILALIALIGCGSPESSIPSSHETLPATLELQLEALPEPEGVNAALWGELTAELARVLAERTASVPPEGSASAAILSYDEESAALGWGYYSAGDYDQNGEVNISDLTPLGANFGKAAPGGGEGEGGGFDPASIESVVDGDGNGEINIADVTPIGVNFGVVVEGYRVYRSDDIADYPGGAGEPNGPGAELVADIPLSSAAGGPDERRRFSFTAEQADPPAGELAESYYWVRPYDGAEEGVPSNGWQLGAANQAPIAVLGAEPTSGLAPLTVDFQAFSSIDIDGVIVKYEWDFDGPAGGSEWLDTGSEGFVEHTYEEEGGYLAMVRITDDDGATDTDVLPLSVRTPIPPVAVLRFDMLTETPPLHVSFDASGSSDPDGRIMRYEWDFDNDGIYDYDSGDEPYSDFYYYETGVFTMNLRVTDNDGLTDRAIRFVNIEVADEWHTSLVTDEIMISPGKNELLDAGGSPLVFFNRAEGGSRHLYYTRATDGLGIEWSEPAMLGVEGVHVYNYAVATVEGRPAIALYMPLGIYPPTWYARAEDAGGASWPELEIIYQPEEESIAGVSPFQMHIVEGLPLIFGTRRVLNSLDPLGEAWDEPFSYGFYMDLRWISLAMVNGLPAMGIYGNEKTLQFRRAVDAHGHVWAPTKVIDFATSTGLDPSIVDAGGYPAIAYIDSTFGVVKFIRALDPEGEEWAEPIWLDEFGWSPIEMAVIDGRPTVIYKEDETNNLKFIAANDARGASWGFPQVIDAEVNVPSSLGYKVMALTSVNGNPAAIYVISGPALKYVSYY